jgi:hypothetical protein
MPYKDPEKQRSFARKYYAANKELVNARSVQWQLNNKEKASASCKLWKSKNKEKIKVIARKYRKQPEVKIKSNQYQREWRGRNRAHANAEANKHRAKHCEELRDSYVCKTLTQNSSFKVKDIPPALIELKREELKLKRLIKEKQNGREKSTKDSNRTESATL